MSHQSEYLRDQAERAERLSKAVSDLDTCGRLAKMSRDYRAEADRLDANSTGAAAGYGKFR